MAIQPATHYAKTSDGVHIAYQAVGDGDQPLLFIWNTWSNVDVMWESPAVRSWLERLASFSRLILMDKRGTGVSDRTCMLGSFEDQVDDVLAVLDALGLESVVVVGAGDAGMLSLLFAASHPERVESLVLLEACARRTRGDDYPFGRTVEEAMPALAALILPQWGAGVTPLVAVPSECDDASRAFYAKLERNSVSPDSFLALCEVTSRSDVRSVLPSIHMPCLVVHRTDDPYMPVGMGRYLGEHIPQARYVELDGVDHPTWAGDATSVLDEVEAFVTGTRPQRPLDRVLVTVLFTDIVGSTETAAGMGDSSWRRLLENYFAGARRAVDDHRGKLIKTTGDGVLATFDGPGRAIRAAQSIREFGNALGIRTRSGLHTGEVEVIGDDVAGLAVHIASRVMAEASAGAVFVSSSVPPLVVGSGIDFADGGDHTLKGVPGAWRLYVVTA